MAGFQMDYPAAEVQARRRIQPTRANPSATNGRVAGAASFIGGCPVPGGSHLPPLPYASHYCG